MCVTIGFNWRNMLLLSHIMFCSKYALFVTNTRSLTQILTQKKQNLFRKTRIYSEFWAKKWPLKPLLSDNCLRPFNNFLNLARELQLHRLDLRDQQICVLLQLGEFPLNKAEVNISIQLESKDSKWFFFLRAEIFNLECFVQKYSYYGVLWKNIGQVSLHVTWKWGKSINYMQI